MASVLSSKTGSTTTRGIGAVATGVWGVDLGVGFALGGGDGRGSMGGATVSEIRKIS